MARDPKSLRYAPSHEWVDLQGDVATVGISSFAVAELTDLVYMALPEVGQEITAGTEFGEVESVKAVSPLIAPVSGTVTEVNAPLVDRLESLADDPYDQGWIIRVRTGDPAQVDRLLSYDDYQKQISG